MVTAVGLTFIVLFSPLSPCPPHVARRSYCSTGGLDCIYVLTLGSSSPLSVSRRYCCCCCCCYLLLWWLLVAPHCITQGIAQHYRDTCTYKQIQRACKERKLGGKASAEVLVARLVHHDVEVKEREMGTQQSIQHALWMKINVDPRLDWLLLLINFSTSTLYCSRITYVHYPCPVTTCLLNMACCCACMISPSHHDVDFHTAHHKEGAHRTPSFHEEGCWH